MVAAPALRQTPPQSTAGASIEIRDVSHRFELHGQPLPVLDRVSLSVEAGSFTALIGPSGCGKSTLLRLLAGLDRPTRGEVLADGAAIEKPDPARILVFQDPTLYPWRTVRGNIMLGPEAQGTSRNAGARVDEVIRLVGLDGFASAYPRQLSGGMAQRVALARALVNDPRLLLLDEPLGKLDSLTRLAMQEELVGLWRRAGMTALLVTHDVEEALVLSQRVIVFGQRPARVIADLKVDLPYPRHRGDPRLSDLRREALNHLGLAKSW
jgi:NitT/TauT family transport system ATP-binding protein